MAGEVRALASRSAAAAKDIKALIGDSVTRVAEGSSQVEEAGRTMDEIVQSVQRVNDLVAEISAASEEQSRGIDQVHQAVSQMDQVTQQNAALVEEAAAATGSLKAQAGQLSQAVSVFRIPAGTQAATAAAAAPAAMPPARAPACGGSDAPCRPRRDAPGGSAPALPRQQPAPRPLRPRCRAPRHPLPPRPHAGATTTGKRSDLAGG